MQDYFLVIDTETSGLPKKWDAPYGTKKNWPHVLQIAWLIYKSDGELIKKENHYLKPRDFKINKASTKIHQITLEVLQEKGEERLEIFRDLSNDIAIYQPLIIAHFAELDYCMVGAEYHRLALPNPFTKSNFFCTLKASAYYVKNPAFKFLKLNVFYKTLFNKRPENLHNALADAELTAEIFFHLLKKGEVTDQLIEEQSEAIKKDKFATTETPKLYFIALIIVLLISIAIYYYGK